MATGPSFRRTPRSAFTLVETLTTLALTAVVVALFYLSLRTATRLAHSGHQAENPATALAELRQELRNAPRLYDPAYTVAIAPDPRIPDASRLWFTGRRFPPDTRTPEVGYPVAIECGIDPNRRRLLLTVQRLNERYPHEGQTGTLCRAVRRFNAWAVRGGITSDVWEGSADGLPDAVILQLVTEDRPHKTHRLTVFLPASMVMTSSIERLSAP